MGASSVSSAYRSSHPGSAEFDVKRRTRATLSLTFCGSSARRQQGIPSGLQVTQRQCGLAILRLERKRLFSSVMIGTTMDHSGVFPIYARLDNGQVIRIESIQKILYDLEAIDIENDEYQFWMRTVGALRF
jgi:hypothetical protein